MSASVLDQVKIPRILQAPVTLQTSEKTSDEVLPKGKLVGRVVADEGKKRKRDDKVSEQPEKSSKVSEEVLSASSQVKPPSLELKKAEDSSSSLPSSSVFPAEQTGNNSQANTPFLVTHVRYFSNKNGDLTLPSMFSALTEKLHLGYVESGAISGAVTVASGFCPIPAAEAHKIRHNGDSLIIRPDGTIDEDYLNNLLSYSQPGKDFLSSIDIDSFLADYGTRGDGSHNSASAGEFKLLLRLGCDHWEQIDGNYVACISKNNIRMFYLDHDAFCQRIETGELPVAKPQV